jgi:glycosyltransferase involved in cell wall biosynthesis
MDGLKTPVARAAFVRDSPDSITIALGLAALLLIPFLLAVPLGRSLDPHSFAAFSLALSIVLAISLLRTAVVRPPAMWVQAGFASIALLLVLDILVVWLIAPNDEGSYGAAVSLAKVTLLLEAPFIVFVIAGVSVLTVRSTFLWSMPAIIFTLVAEAAPGRVLSLVFGQSYPAAAALVRPLAAGTMLAAMTVVAAQVLMHQGRIWWVSRVVLVAFGLVPAAVVLRAHPFQIAMATFVAEVVAFVTVVIPTALAFRPRVCLRRVVFLAYRDLRHELGGGSELYVHEIARRLVDSGSEVTVFSARVPGAPTSEVIDRVRYVRAGSAFTVYPRAAIWLLSRLRSPDVVVDVQNGVPFFAPLYSSRPTVAVVHHICAEQWQMAFGPWLGRFGSWVERRVAPSVYATVPYVTVSAATRSDLIRLGLDPQRIWVVPNGTPRLPDPGPVPRTGGPSICYLGRLVPHKRVELLLEAVARLRGRFPTLVLTVVGRGWWASRLVPTVEALGIQDAVRFVGWADESRKARILKESWVLGMPSAREGWGIAVAEAASMGTPAVAFRIGGLQESILHAKTGILVDDLDEFVSTLERLLSDDELRRRMGSAARDRALSFTWDKAAERFAVVLDRAAAAAEVAREGEPVAVAV